MNFYNSFFVGVFIFFTPLAFVGCSDRSVDPEAMDASGEPYQITCTVGMITDIVRNVAGDYAEVVGMIGEGVDPHLYKPTRGDVVRLSQTDVVFYNGLHLEGKMTDVLVRVGTMGKPVKAVTEAILDEADYLLQKSDGSRHTDPHVWMDVSGWLRAVPVVAETLSEFDPEHAADYRANAATYMNKLQALDIYTKTAMATIPEGRRVLVTAHDAFQYFGRAYGIEVRGIQGISTESEAGVRDLEMLVDFIVERKVPAVFVETSVAEKNVRALVEGARARGHEVIIGGSLFSDAMGQAGTYEGTYIGMIDHNVTTIVNALGGQAGGFRPVVSGK
ncbi:MAG: zinc ABC transporter substrate-binding protein [Puniceicoccaceae bacterium]|nr:zinc ABC transporter substrate-binding protein [Puniceicoccaceae bacterium]